MSGFTFEQVIFSIIIPITISIYAACLSWKSDKKMKALTAYHLDKQLAMMPVHHHDLAYKIYSTEAIYRFKNDFKALLDLKKFIPTDKKKELKIFLTPILSMLQTQADHPGVQHTPEWEKAFKEIKQIAPDFEID